MDTPRKPTIVVGVSGSGASLAALGWAADEARRRRGQLRVIRVRQQEHRASYAPAAGQEGRSLERDFAVSDLADALREVLGPESPDDTEFEVVDGTAERVLVDSSAGADLLVLGSTSGFLAGRSIGPVIRTCLSRAHCPVVVVGPEGSFGPDSRFSDCPARAADHGLHLVPTG